MMIPGPRLFFAGNDKPGGGPLVAALERWGTAGTVEGDRAGDTVQITKKSPAYYAALRAEAERLHELLSGYPCDVIGTIAVADPSAVGDIKPMKQEIRRAKKLPNPEYFSDPTLLEFLYFPPNGNEPYANFIEDPEPPASLRNGDYYGDGEGGLWRQPAGADNKLAQTEPSPTEKGRWDWWPFS